VCTMNISIKIWPSKFRKLLRASCPTQRDNSGSLDNRVRGYCSMLINSYRLTTKLSTVLQWLTRRQVGISMVCRVVSFSLLVDTSAHPSFQQRAEVLPYSQHRRSNRCDTCRFTHLKSINPVLRFSMLSRRKKKFS
jgi:hypothetical protein